MYFLIIFFSKYSLLIKVFRKSNHDSQRSKIIYSNEIYASVFKNSDCKLKVNKFIAGFLKSLYNLLNYLWSHRNYKQG